MHGVECPTCFNKYAVDKILKHADMCASSIIDMNISNIVQEDCKLDEVGSECWNDNNIHHAYHSMLQNFVGRVLVETGWALKQKRNKNIIEHEGTTIKQY